MSIKAILLGLVLAICGAPLLGCNRGPAFGNVSGVVTLDGKPLESGNIRLMPIDGNTRTAGAAINSDGHYLAEQVPVNKFRVEISCGKAPNIPAGADPLKYQGVLGTELVPAKYNVQSELTVDVKEGINQQDFKLETK